MHPQDEPIPMFLLIVKLLNEADISYFLFTGDFCVVFKECV